MTCFIGEQPKKSVSLTSIKSTCCGAAPAWQTHMMPMVIGITAAPEENQGMFLQLVEMPSAACDYHIRYLSE